MPVGIQPIDPRIRAALPQVRAFMKRNNHQQKDLIRLTGLSQPQISKFLSGQRHRVTDAVRAICQYAEIDLNAEFPPTAPPLGLSQSARRVLEDNPRAAAMVVRVIEALLPVLSTMNDSVTGPQKEAP